MSAAIVGHRRLIIIWLSGGDPYHRSASFLHPLANRADLLLLCLGQIERADVLTATVLTIGLVISGTTWAQGPRPGWPGRGPRSLFGGGRSVFQPHGQRPDQSRAALEASDKARRELLADVSHELMTPLRAMHGHLETLTMSELQIEAATRGR